MNIVPVIKSLVGLASSLGAGAVVGNAIKATTPDDLNRVGKVLTAVGSVVVSGSVGILASSWAEKQVDELATSVRNFRGSRTAAAAENLASSVKEDVENILDEDQS